MDRIGRVADRIAQGDVRLPEGDLLTVRRQQTLGIDFGMKPGFERMHWLFDEHHLLFDLMADGRVDDVQSLMRRHVHHVVGWSAGRPETVPSLEGQR